MKYSTLVLGVCHPQKLIWMPQTLKSIDSSIEFSFDRKLLAIDEFKGWVLPGSHRYTFEGSGWEVLIDNHMSRPKSMIHGLDVISEDVVFYHEDDVLVDLPARDHVDTLFSHRLEDDRECGMVSLTLGGTKAWFCGGQGPGDLARAGQNTLFDFGSCFAFLREEENRDKHFFEFPGLFVRADLLRQCLDYTMKHCRKMQIEQALTKAWFDLGFHEKYWKASIAKSNFHDVFNDDYKQVFNKCRLLTNLDPRQGSSPYFGSHTV